MVAATPPQPAAGSYKSAVDDFLRSEDGSFPAPQKKDGRCRPDVPEAQTQLLQQLLGSATTATAREELLSTLRSASSRLFLCSLFIVTGGSQDVQTF